MLPEAGVFIGGDRLASCRSAAGMGFNIALLDDGFQHRRLGRGIDVVLFDPADRFALREPIASLYRSDILLVKNKSMIPDRLKKILNPRHRIFEYRVTARGYRQAGGEVLLPTDLFFGKKILAFCGIARPERFFRLLEELGAEVRQNLAYPDHYPYRQRDLQKTALCAEKAGAAAAVTTEKDAVRLAEARWPHDRIPLYVLKIGVDVEAGFFNILREFLVAHLGRSQGH